MKFQNFDWEKLSKVRGRAHEAIVGEWISWWIEIDPENHMALNPAPYVGDRSADIVFLRNVEEEGSDVLPLYYPIGVAEVENDPNKWMQKLEALRAYEEEYSKLKTESGEVTLRFLLLCATAKSAHKRKFEELIQHVRNASKDSESSWILYCLGIASSGKDSCPIVREDDEVMWRESIESGDLFTVKKGEVAT